ncbi:MAG: hypothetical protein RBT33_04070 [Candidatus Dojkabacteria bacterium]|jgi:uncharacterized protein YdcH (DUF465 family)|nr:hypothetical protein [Candidatus Dojkabacteria bacterium]
MDPFENNPEINSTVPESTVDQPAEKESEDSNDAKISQLEQKVQTQEEEIASLKQESANLKSIFATYLEIEYNRVSMLPQDNSSYTRLGELANIITAIKQ